MENPSGGSVCDQECLLAHNLRNKLAAIVGYCELLVEGCKDPALSRKLAAIGDIAKGMSAEISKHECRVTELLGR